MGEPDQIDMMGEYALRGELREALDKIERLRAERDRLDSYLDHTADGKLVCECETFFCPRCAGKLRVVIDYGVPPMPWSLSMAYSTREAAQAAERNGE